MAGKKGNNMQGLKGFEGVRMGTGLRRVTRSDDNLKPFVSQRFILKQQAYRQSTAKTCTKALCTHT